MTRFSYKVVPAPTKGLRAKGARGVEGRFAEALSQIMNAYGAEGWEYVRADTLPCDSRTTMGKKQTSYQNMLVFRRVLGAEETEVSAENTGSERAGAAPDITADECAPQRVGETAEAARDDAEQDVGQDVGHDTEDDTGHGAEHGAEHTREAAPNRDSAASG